MLSLALPAAARSVPDSPTLSTTSRLDDRRFVTTGDRAYEVGTEAGRYPAMGFHTRGEMGGVWSPPIKLLDGIWFGIDDEWIGPATKFTSGYGHVKMDLPGRDGLRVSRTDFVPDGKRAVLVGLKFAAGDANQSFALKMDAHSELMGVYPWGETTPSQTEFNLQDSVAVEGGKLVFRENGKPVTNAEPHDWAAVVGSTRTPTSSETGADYRRPQDPPVICPASGPDTPDPPDLCDDTDYGNAVYTIRGLYDLADMARSKGDEATANWAEDKASGMRSRFEAAWWFGRQGATQYADSLDDPGNEQVFQRHWIGVTPMDVDLIGKAGDTNPGLASYPHGSAALVERELACYTDRFGMYHTGTGPTIDGVDDTQPFCDSHESEVPAERNIFTLNTAIMAVGEGNYGRLGDDQQRHYTDANADLQLIPDEQPGAMPEIAPSPDYGRSIDNPFNERAMVLQAWGAYGTIWPVVHQQLGIRPDMGRDELEVVPQVPPGSPGVSGKNIRLGRGSVAVSADHDGRTYTTKVSTGLDVDLTIGHTIPRGANVDSVKLDGRNVRYHVRTTNRGKEVFAHAPTTGAQTLVVKVQ